MHNEQKESEKKSETEAKSNPNEQNKGKREKQKKHTHIMQQQMSRQAERKSSGKEEGQTTEGVRVFSKALKPLFSAPPRFLRCCLPLHVMQNKKQLKKGKHTQAQQQKKRTSRVEYSGKERTKAQRCVCLRKKLCPLLLPDLLLLSPPRRRVLCL